MGARSGIVFWALLIVFMLSNVFAWRVALHAERASRAALQRAAALDAVKSDVEATKAIVHQTIVLQLDTLRVGVSALGRGISRLNGAVARIESDEADIAARFDSEDYVTNEEFVSFRAHADARYASFTRETGDSLSAIRQSAAQMAEETDARFSREMVNRNSADLELRVQLNRAGNWQKVGTGVNLLTLGGFIAHVLGK